MIKEKYFQVSVLLIMEIVMGFIFEVVSSDIKAYSTLILVEYLQAIICYLLLPVIYYLAFTKVNKNSYGLKSFCEEFSVNRISLKNVILSIICGLTLCLAVNYTYSGIVCLTEAITKNVTYYAKKAMVFKVVFNNVIINGILFSILYGIFIIGVIEKCYGRKGIIPLLVMALSLLITTWTIEKSIIYLVVGLFISLDGYYCKGSLNRILILLPLFVLNCFIPYIPLPCFYSSVMSVETAKYYCFMDFGIGIILFSLAIVCIMLKNKNIQPEKDKITFDGKFSLLTALSVYIVLVVMKNVL